MAFLIPLVLLWFAGRRRTGFRKMSYVFLGFFIGFFIQLAGGFLGAYVYRLPVLPLILRQQNMSSQEIARIVLFYNTAFDMIYLSSLFVSLLLIAYGICKLFDNPTEETR